MKKSNGTFLQAENSVQFLKHSDAVIINIGNQSVGETDMIKKMISRFPHLAENVFKNLAIEDLKNCLNVSRHWSNFIQNEKFPWKKKIQNVRSICKQPTKNENVNSVLKRAPMKVLQDFCLALKDSTQINTENGFSPIHIAAETGMSDLCKFVMSKTDNEHPKDRKGVTGDFF